MGIAMEVNDMTRQEAILRKVKEYLGPNLKYENETLIDGVVYVLLIILKSQGMVLKVDAELPKYHSSARVFLHEAYPIVQKELIEAGFTAYEELM